MIRFAPLFFLLGFLSSLHAQTVTMTEEITLRNESAYEIIGNLKGNLLLLRDRTTEFEVQAFNEQMREIWSKELELDRRLPSTLGTIAHEDNFTLFYTYRLKNQTMLKAHKYNPAANLVDSATVKNLGYLFFSPRFELRFSEDKSKALIFYVEKMEVIHTYLFDVNSMRLIWEQQFLPDDFDYNRDIVHTVVTNEGDLYLVIEKNNLRYKRDPHYYEIHQYFGTVDSYTKMNIPLEGKVTYDVLFQYDNMNNQLTAGGFYADENPGRASGYFILTIPRVNEQNFLISFQEFEPSFVTTLMGRDGAGNKGIMECSVQDVVLRQDGGILIIGERNRQYERRMAATNRVVYDTYSRFIVDYFYDDLFLLAMHPDGRTHWQQVLPKKQYSQDDNGIFSSYFLLKTPRRLRFMFNDEIRYENTVSEYVINGHGEFIRRSVLSTQNLRLRLRFRDATQISAREVVIPSERRNQLRLVKVEYP